MPDPGIELDEGAVEAAARVMCDGMAAVDGPPWNWENTSDYRREHFRDMARLAISTYLTTAAPGSVGRDEQEVIDMGFGGHGMMTVEPAERDRDDARLSEGKNRRQQAVLGTTTVGDLEDRYGYEYLRDPTFHAFVEMLVQERRAALDASPSPAAPGSVGVFGNHGVVLGVGPEDEVFSVAVDGEMFIPAPGSVGEDARLVEIRERLAAATPGPWNVRAETHEDETGERYLDLSVTAGGEEFVAGFDETEESEPNADFIANAPADIAYLLFLLTPDAVPEGEE